MVAGEAVRLAPGEYLQGRNESDGPVRALAFGATPDDGEVRVPLPRRECVEADYHVSHVHDEGITRKCPGCGNEFDV